MTTTRTVIATVSINPRGFGFVNEVDGDGLSAFVAPPLLNPFLADDRVEATLSQGPDGRWSATALSLVERTRAELFGEVVQHRGERFLRVDREVANTDLPLDDARARAEQAIRNYDPCISCATHFLTLRIERS